MLGKMDVCLTLAFHDPAEVKPDYEMRANQGSESYREKFWKKEKGKTEAYIITLSAVTHSALEYQKNFYLRER